MAFMGGYKVTYGIGALFIIMSIINVAAQWYVAAMILFASGIITFAIAASQQPKGPKVTARPAAKGPPAAYFPTGPVKPSYDQSSRSPIH